MKIFDKKRFKNRMAWLAIAALVLFWAAIHLALFNAYNTNADDMNSIIKLFIMDHIIWWHIAPFFYGFIGFILLGIGIFKPNFRG